MPHKPPLQVPTAEDLAVGRAAGERFREFVIRIQIDMANVVDVIADAAAFKRKAGK